METIIIKPKNKAAIPFLKKLLLSLSDVESVLIQSDDDIEDKAIYKAIKQGETGKDADINKILKKLRK